MSAPAGLHRATVANAVDPSGRRRLLVSAPALFGSGAVWAEPCVPVGASSPPAAGATVWIQFEAGDPTRPVWIGVRP